MVCVVKRIRTKARGVDLVINMAYPSFRTFIRRMVPSVESGRDSRRSRAKERIGRNSRNGCESSYPFANRVNSGTFVNYSECIESSTENNRGLVSFCTRPCTVRKLYKTGSDPMHDGIDRCRRGSDE